MPSSEAHIQRVNAEFQKVGLTKRGIKKFSKRSLHELIHPDEHIAGAIYGRFGAGSFNWYEGILLCTDRRLMFLDLTPGVKDFTELTYEVVTGVERTTAGPFTSVTVFAGITNYNLRFVNPHSANIFAHYVERRRLEQPANVNASANGSSSP